MPQALIARGSPQGRWVLTAAVLGSGMAMLDGTVVNIALRNIGGELGATVPQLQWVVNAYLLALASLILVGGSLGDHLGRRRVFLVGVTWFAVASALCGLAQSPGQLIAARLLQGIGAALLTPGSLAMIQGSFRPTDRGRVIGQWAGLGGVAAGPRALLRGWASGRVSAGSPRPRGRCSAAGSSTTPAGGGSSCSTCRSPRRSCWSPPATSP